MPAGAFKPVYGEGERWADGVGALRVAMLSPAPMVDSEVEGELCFVGGKEAYAHMQWHELDLGAGWTKEAAEEWVRDRASAIWAVEGSMYGRARGSAVEQLSERCARTASGTRGKKAEKAAAIMMELM